MARRKVWKKGKIHTRRVKSKFHRGGYVKIRGRWEYPNGKKKGRRWKKV